jgi:hypothetical protein
LSKDNASQHNGGHEQKFFFYISRLTGKTKTHREFARSIINAACLEMVRVGTIIKHGTRSKHAS